MRDLPDIARLLALAEGEGPLAARCRAIAERERRAGWAPYAAIAAELAALLGEPAEGRLLARLAAEIRAGRFDAPGPERARVELILWRHAIQRLHENEPEFIIYNK